MKRIAFILFVLFLFNSFSHAQRVLIEKRFDGAWINDALVLDDGYLVLGHRDREFQRDRMIHHRHTPFVARLNGEMDVIWTKDFPEMRHRAMKSMSLGKDGFYVLGSDHLGRYSDHAAGWLVKMDFNGNRQWEKHYPYANYNSTEGVWTQELKDGSLLVMIRIYRNFNSYGDLWLHRIGADGKHIWDRKVGTNYFYCQLAMSRVDDDGTVLLTGSAYPTKAKWPDGGSDGWIYRFHPDRPDQPLIDKTYADYPRLIFWGALKLGDGGWWVVGQAKSRETGRNSGVLVEIDQRGNIVSKHKWDLKHGLIPRDLYYDNDTGHLIVAGFSQTERSATDHHMHVFELDENFRVLHHQAGDEGRYLKIYPFDGGEMLAVSTVGVHVLR